MTKKLTIAEYWEQYPQKSKEARRRNERASWTEPFANAKLTVEVFQKKLQDSMRREPKSLQSKDTSQSRYYCVFTDCPCHNKEQHADINAAVNIGRRFLESLMHK